MLHLDIIGHVAAVPGPVACPSRGARPFACPSCSARSRNCRKLDSRGRGGPGGTNPEHK